jgi:hypothetical protein
MLYVSDVSQEKSLERFMGRTTGSDPGERERKRASYNNEL